MHLLFLLAIVALLAAIAWMPRKGLAFHAKRTVGVVALAAVCAFFFMSVGLAVDFCFYNVMTPFFLVYWPSAPSGWPISFTWVAWPIGFVAGLFFQAIRCYYSCRK